jgi:hypothetical protein
MHAGGEHPVCLVVAFENPVDARAAVSVLDRVVMMVAPLGLYALANDVVERLGGEQLDVGASIVVPSPF